VSKAASFDELERRFIAAVNQPLANAPVDPVIDIGCIRAEVRGLDHLCNAAGMSPRTRAPEVMSSNFNDSCFHAEKAGSDVRAVETIRRLVPMPAGVRFNARGFPVTCLQGAYTVAGRRSCKQKRPHRADSNYL
jgi:hypothetical protein